MKLIISSNQLLSYLDTSDGNSIILQRGHGRFYGITWDDQLMYVTRQAKAYTRDKRMPRTIVCYDRQFRYVELLSLEDIGMLNPHQITMHDGKIFIANTGRNAITAYDMVTKETTDFFPFDDEEHRDTDKNHFNSIYFKDGFMYVSAHNRDDPSFILKYAYPSMELVETINIGHQIHNVFIDDDGTLWTCDSNGSKNVISPNGPEFIMERGYTRGLAVTRDKVIVGTSYRSQQQQYRINRDGFISIFDRKTRQLEERYVIPNCGNIFDVRVLDEPDLAHTGIPFLTPSGKMIEIPEHETEGDLAYA